MKQIFLEQIAADKSLSHRAAIFALLANKKSKIKNFLFSYDTNATLEAIKLLGARVKRGKNLVVITPPKKIISPKQSINCQNSGTLMRFLLGLLSNQKGNFSLCGDESLSRRPMGRVVEPLRSLGAQIQGANDGNFAPLVIKGKRLKHFDFTSQIPSAQIKTALILSALFAKKPSFYHEKSKSRDHSEKMLKKMGAKISKKNGVLKIKPLKKPLKALQIKIPNDPSSAFFFAVAVALKPKSKIVLKNVLINKTRIEAFKILQKMGLKIKFKKVDGFCEKTADIYVRHSKLKAIHVNENIAYLIDEIPALAIAFAVADGASKISNAKELRIKECDRIKAIVKNLNAVGIKAKEFDDGFEVEGGSIKNGVVKSYGDHRIAMSFLIASLIADIKIDNTECIDVSFPGFEKCLKKLEFLMKLQKKGSFCHENRNSKKMWLLFWCNKGHQNSSKNAKFFYDRATYT